MDWERLPVAPLFADVRAYCSYVKMYCKRARLLSSHPRLFIPSFKYDNRPFQIVCFVFPIQTMWYSLGNLPFFLFIMYTCAHGCTCIGWHLRETALRDINHHVVWNGNKTYKLRRSIITNYSQKRRRTYSIFRLVGSGDRVKQSVNQTFSFKAFTVNFSDLQVV